MIKPHVAVLDEELCFPLTSGKRIRTYHLLSHLSNDFRITYIAHQNPKQEEQLSAVQQLKSIGIEPMLVHRRIPPKSGLRFYFRLARNLFEKNPYSVVSHTSSEFEHSIRELARNDPPQLWHFEWTPYGVYLQACRNAADRCSLVVAHNVESLIWKRYHLQEKNLLKKWYIQQQYKKFHRFEESLYQQIEQTVAVSEADAMIIRSQFHGQNVSVVENGVAIEYFTSEYFTNYPKADFQRQENTLLFLGSLDWRPNLDGLNWFIDNIWPIVQKLMPSIKLWIVGRSPPNWLIDRCQNQPGLELHADVVDVRPYLYQTGQLIVPLRIGGGSRLKILEAAICGTPIVSTTIGAEGLRLKKDHDYLQADTEEEFARAIVHTLSNKPETATRIENAKSITMQFYDWKMLAQQLKSTWHQLILSKNISTQ